MNTRRFIGAVTATMLLVTLGATNAASAAADPCVDFIPAQYADADYKADAKYHQCRSLYFLKDLNDLRARADRTPLTPELIVKARSEDFGTNDSPSKIDPKTADGNPVPALRVNSDLNKWAQYRADMLAAIDGLDRHAGMAQGAPSWYVINSRGNVGPNLSESPEYRNGTYMFGPEALAWIQQFRRLGNQILPAIPGIPSDWNPIDAWYSELDATGSPEQLKERRQAYGHYLTEVSHRANVAGFGVAQSKNGSTVAVLEIGYIGPDQEAARGTTMSVEDAIAALRATITPPDSNANQPDATEEKEGAGAADGGSGENGATGSQETGDGAGADTGAGSVGDGSNNAAGNAEGSANGSADDSAEGTTEGSAGDSAEGAEGNQADSAGTGSGDTGSVDPGTTSEENSDTAGQNGDSAGSGTGNANSSGEAEGNTGGSGDAGSTGSSGEVEGKAGGTSGNTAPTDNTASSGADSTAPGDNTAQKNTDEKPSTDQGNADAQGTADSASSNTDKATEQPNAGGSKPTEGATTTSEESTGGGDTAIEAPTPLAELSVSQATAGAEVRVNAKGFTPGAKVAAALHSDPYQLGSFLADENGLVTFSFKVPAGVPVGAHTVVLTEEGSGKSARVAIEVTQVEEQNELKSQEATRKSEETKPAHTSTQKPAAALAQTGVNAGEDGLAALAILAFAGVGLLILGSASRRARG